MISDLVIRALRGRGVLVLVLAAATAALLGWGASRLEMGQDVTELFPSLTEEDQAVLDVLERSTLLDKLYVEVAGPDQEILAAFAARLAKRLERDPRIVAVESVVTPDEEALAGRVVFEHRFQLLDPGTEGLEERLSPEGVRRQVELARARLLGPVAGLARKVTRDPLGLADLVAERMGEGLRSDRVRMYHGVACTPGLDRCLVALRTRVPSLRVDDAGRLVDDVREAVLDERTAGPEQRIVARLTGGHVFSSESARAVKRDVTRAFAMAVAGIVLLFLAFFRRPVFLLAGLLPPAAGVLAGFGASGLVFGRVSGIAVGFGSIVVGVSIDYSIHFLRQRQVEASGEPLDALARILPTMLTGFASTAIVFAFYGTSGFPLVRELGLFAGAGVMAGFLSACLVLPLMPGRFLPGGAGLPPTRSRIAASRLLGPSRAAAAAVLVTAALAVLVAAAFIPRLRLDDDIRRLDYRDPETARFADEFERRWLGPQRGRMVVAWGGSVEEALERSEEVASALDAAGLEHTSAASVLPSVRTQLANVAWLLDRDWRALGGVLDEEASSLGFRAATFDPFFEDIAAARRGEPPCLEPDDLEGTPMHHLVQGSVIAGASRAAVLTFLPGEDRDGVPGSVAAMRPGVVVASRVEIMNRVFEAVRSDVLGLIAVSLLGILLVLVLRYRRVRPALLAVVPVLVACVVTAGLFAMSDRAVNAIAVLAFTLILGVGLDYGVFIVDALGSGRVRDHAAGAVLVSGLTTLVSFGVLWTCRNPVLRSTGLVVLAGVGASLLAALLLVPALHVLLAGRKP